MKITIDKLNLFLKFLLVTVIVIISIFYYYSNLQEKEILDDFNSNYTVIEHQAGSMICVEKETGNLYHIHKMNHHDMLTFIVDSPVYDENGNIKNVNK